ncbi:hypothetical protein MPPM_4449 [Methylorubrum populi]|uniref:(2Fe-2S) ferredoxin domain-containing protein n=1 Tax=Methylorubrum populi TaxID=223967 RepID=A0A160PJ85_9HYPH|nr:hypothetical protein [Methylorubrum populi]BAU93054.1 hypothetical protein MPPM_4449 [Methylorubrum populi]
MGRRQDPGGAARETQGETARGGTTGAGMAEARTAKAGFSDLVLVCRKCAKRQGVDRKRIGRAVKRALKQGARDTGSTKRAGKVRLLETGCLGPCPKRMLTLATPDSLARRRVILVDPALETLAAEALVLAPLLPPRAARTSPGAASPDDPADGAGNG